jgi:hypothetical protein
MQHLASSRQLLPTDVVWKAGMQKWAPASSIKGLFPNPAPAEAPPVRLPPRQPDSPPPRPDPVADIRKAADAALHSIGEWFGGKKKREAEGPSRPPPAPPSDRPRRRSLSVEIRSGEPDRPRSRGPGGRASAADREVINDSLPADQRPLLLPSELAYHFAYIDANGGCWSTSAARQWILVTDRRVVYVATIQEEEYGKSNYVRTSGSIPVAKIGFVGTSSSAQTEGCSRRQVCLLKINSGGGTVSLAIPSEAEATRLQAIIEELIAT